LGRSLEAVGERRRVWSVKPELLYAQLVKRYRRRRLASVERRVCLGAPETYRARLQLIGLSGRVQTAFIERLNLTIRRSIAALARRSWSSAQSVSELTLQFDWWRAVYHFARPHASLRQSRGDQTSRRNRSRHRARTPAQAAGLTHRGWTVLELLAYPAPPLSAG
jgi:transposase InsO family protein